MIDILLATYNGEKYIDRQLKSLLTQDIAGLDTGMRLFIRDDGSSDDTMGKIRKRLDYYREKRPDPIEVRIIDDAVKTGTPAGNFMRLLQQSDGDYIMFSDQDDMWYRRKTGESYLAIRRLEDRYGKDVPILVHTDLSLMDENSRKTAESFFDYQNLPKSDSLRTLLIQNTVTGCTVMMNRRAAELLKRAPAEKMALMHDHYLALMVAATGHIGFIDEPLIRYRQHPENSIGAHEADSLKEYKNRLFGGREAFLKNMDMSYRQAEDIVERYEKEIREAKGEETVRLLKGYSDLIMADKNEKINFFRKNGIYKNGVLKKAVQLIWC